MRQWLNFTKFLVFMAGGQDYLEKLSLPRLAHYHLAGWDPMSTARQLMQEMTHGEYLKGKPKHI